MGIATFNSRRNYFDGCGQVIQDATSLENAIKLAKLDYTVEKRPLSTYDMKGHVVKIPDMFATLRTDTNQTLGVVGKNYNILQNIEAFDFLDSLVAEGARFETAGTFKKNEAASFITCSTEPLTILDDEFMPYILLTNSFDGSGCVRVMFTPIRVFCSNCLNRAIKQAVNKISIRHCNSLKGQMEQAKEILLQNTNYLVALKEESEKLAVTPFSEEAFEALARDLFKTEEGASAIIQERSMIQLEALLTAYKQDDLQNFNNTAYKAVQAVADFESHKPVFRNTNNPFTNFQIVTAGMPLLNMVAERMNSLAA